MKTTTLDEVKKLATPGKLKIVPNKAFDGKGTNTVYLCHLRTDERSAGMASVLALADVAIDEAEANAALLAHSMNIRDELIEALEKACALARASDDEYEAIDGIEQTEALEAVLAKARTVEMP